MTLTHKTTTGQSFTRNTKAAYSHVTVGTPRYPVSDQVAVVAWHKTPEAAAKYARQYADPRAAFAGVTVEAVNGGTR